MLKPGFESRDVVVAFMDVRGHAAFLGEFIGGGSRHGGEKLGRTREGDRMEDFDKL
jgi:hypothetical protein